MGDDKEEMMMSCFRKELIENSPSRRDGISADFEAHTRSQYCQFIRWMCTQFKLYLFQSLSKLNMFILSQGKLTQGIGTLTRVDWHFENSFFLHYWFSLFVMWQGYNTDCDGLDVLPSVLCPSITRKK
jgi:hypothetical protein